MMTPRNAGLTLVEVLVALMVLAIGVAAAAQLQAASLRYSSQAEQLKIATQVAEAEVEWRRQTEVMTGTGLDCATIVPDGFSCEVDVVPCNAVAGTSALTCSLGLVSPIAYKVAVKAAGPRTEPFVLSTVTTGMYVTGLLGDGSVVAPPADTGGETGGGGDGGEPASDGDGGEEGPKPCLEYAGKSGNCKRWAE